MSGMMGGLKDQERASAQCALVSANVDGLRELVLVESRLLFLVRVSTAGFVVEAMEPVEPGGLPASAAGAGEVVCIGLRDKWWKGSRDGTVRGPHRREQFTTGFITVSEQDRRESGGT